MWTKCLLEGDTAQNSTPLTLSSSQGNDLLVADGHGHHADNMDGQTDQDHGHGTSDMESNARAETGPNSASAAIAAADDPDIQIPHVLVGGKPLQASASLASTVLDDNAQADETGSFDEDGVTGGIISDLPRDKTLVGDMEAEVDSLAHEHLPEPPASPTSNTLLSTSSGSTYGEPGSQNTSTSQSGPSSPAKVDGKATKTPSANRLSISYAAGSRRLVIDAGVVEKLKVFRSSGRIEVVVNIEKDGESELKGILVCYFRPSSYHSTS